MASRRDQIQMTESEVAEFLDSPRVMNVATIGPTGHPHLVAMWYAMEGADPIFWTFGKSQKILNLRRDPKITALVEDGDVYEELRGVELLCTAELVEEFDDILQIGLTVASRYQGEAVLSDVARPFIEAQARKRIGVRLRVERVVSWDHRKLAGNY
jgi:PPOX class probable F420-dependent enzyme